MSQKERKAYRKLLNSHRRAAPSVPVPMRGRRTKMAGPGFYGTAAFFAEKMNQYSEALESRSGDILNAQSLEELEGVVTATMRDMDEWSRSLFVLMQNARPTTGVMESEMPYTSMGEDDLG